MDLLVIFSCLLLLYLAFVVYKVIDWRRHQCSYVLDYRCYKPSDDRMLSTEFSGEVIRRNKNLGVKEYKFLLRAIVSSGIGEQTYGPRMVFDGRETCPTYDDAIAEMDEFFCDTIGKLLSRSGVSPSEIDILIVNVFMITTVSSLDDRIMEAKKRLKRGDKIFMISFGAGFECNSCLWEVVRDLNDNNVWSDCIDGYPPERMENPFMEEYRWIQNDDPATFKIPEKYAEFADDFKFQNSTS